MACELLASEVANFTDTQLLEHLEDNDRKVAVKDPENISQHLRNQVNYHLRNRRFAPLVSDVMAYSDEQLKEHLEFYGRSVSVRDAENIDEPFCQRIRDYMRSEVPEPLDLDEVNFKLEMYLDYLYDVENGSEVSVSNERTNEAELKKLFNPNPLTLEQRLEERLKSLKSEQESAAKLEEEGVPLWYPISWLDDVAEHPEDHKELIRYWQRKPGDWMVFTPLLSYWNAFRRSQKTLREEWAGRLPELSSKSKQCREEYAITRPFELLADPTQQSRVDTWIEFLWFQYRSLDHHTRYVKSYQWQHEAEWANLVSKGVLRPGETGEALMEFYTREKYNKENAAAQRLEAEAFDALTAIEDELIEDNLSPSTQMKIQHRVDAAKAQLDVATQHKTHTKERKKAITWYLNHMFQLQQARDEKWFDPTFMNWTRDQLFAIEQEELLSKLLEDPDKPSSGSKTPKRPRSEGETTAPSKRQKRSDTESTTSHEHAARDGLRRKPRSGSASPASSSCAVDGFLPRAVLCTTPQEELSPSAPSPSATVDTATDR